MKNSIFIGRKVAEETRSWLQQNAIGFEEHPLIQIEYYTPEILNISRNKKGKNQFVITSQHAALWLAKNHEQIGFAEDDIICCISEKQKAICKNITRNCFVSQQQNSRSVVELVLQKNFQAKVIFLSGNQSLNTVESLLYNYYFGFQSVEVYRNSPVHFKTQKEFSAYIFFSPGGARNFYNSGCRISESSEIIAIGETTAITCSTLFANRIIVAPEQKEISVVKCAVDLLKKTEFQVI